MKELYSDTQLERITRSYVQETSFLLEAQVAQYHRLIKYGNKRVSEYAKDGIKFTQQFQ